jgi:MFS family permease
MPLVAMDMLALPAVRWGNVAILAIFAMEAGLIYLVTLYLQEVLHLGPIVSGLVFGIPGIASVVAGLVASRFIAKNGANRVLLIAFLIQGVFTAPLLLLGSDMLSMWLLIPALFIGFFGHITAVVAATVTATSGVPEANKGLASGLMTTSQRVASTVGIPVLAAFMILGTDVLSGLRFAFAGDIILTVIALIAISWGLKQSRSDNK